MAFALVLFVGLGFAASASAQDESSWGVQVSVGPQWQVLPQVEKLLQTHIDLTGQEVRVGIVHGRSLGGDWGVSYVHNKIADTSVIQTGGGLCDGYPIAQYYKCYDTGTSYRLHGVSFDGLEAHKYLPFVTIAERVQVGANLAGGISWIKGSAEKKVVSVRTVNEMPTRLYLVPVETVSSVIAADVIKEKGGPSIIPSVRAEAVIAVIVTRGLKLKASAGIGALGYSKFNLSATYLF